MQPVTRTAWDWRPAASLTVLRRRAEILAQIRAFFAERGVLEVETPILSGAAITDPNLASFVTRFEGPELSPHLSQAWPLYLHTSPEFPMKRLLAAGSGPIFQICKVFRNGEAGRLHNPEFTMLEWYRPGFDHHALMAEVDELMQRMLGTEGAEYLSYADAFLRHVGMDPLSAAVVELEACARRYGIEPPAGLSRDALLDLLLSHLVQPQLGQQRPLFLYDYPASQAALARSQGPVAERFELFLHGIELANGFHELADAAEQRKRFEAERERRREMGLPVVPPDERLLAALDAGLPDCAGVALGIDRLLMIACKARSLDEVLAFPIGRA